MNDLLVQREDGTFRYVAREDMQPEDMVVFDGPGAFDSTERLQDALMKEIAAAGGLEAWRALESVR